MTKAPNQKGFTVIEGLLILLAVAIIGGTGYYVYQANNKATDTQNTAQTNANSATPPKKKDSKKASPKTESKTTDSKTTTQ